MNNLLNFKSFFNFLGRNKGFTFINVFGLSVSLMFVILILVYVKQGLSTDSFQENADRIYLTAHEDRSGFAWRIGERVAEHYPEIEKMCPLVAYNGYPVDVSDRQQKANVMLVDTTFFSMFTFPLVEGDPARALETKGYAVISESFARKAFSDRDPMGQFIQVNDSIHVMVNGIISDFKNSTIPYADILININNAKYFNWSLDTKEGNNAGDLQVFFQVVEGTNLQAKEAEVAEFLKEFFWVYERGVWEKVIFIPLRDVYFSEIHGNHINQSSWTFVIVFLFVGILILLFAVINYINLTVAQTGARAKEMATRRLLGSSRGELFLRLILESTIVCFVSFGFGLLLAFALLPFANDLLQTTIDLKGFFTLGNSLIVAALMLVISFISGVMPAIIISNSKPIDIVRGGFRTKTKMVFSKVFITFQNAITIMLLASSITMALQINHMIKAPLGYNTTNILHMSTHQFDGMEKFNAFVNEANQLACVSRLSRSQGIPFTKGNNATVIYEGKNISFQMLIGDSTFFNMLGFEIIHQNNIDGTQTYLSEQALRETELPIDATEFKLWENGDPFPLAGVVRDFRLGNISDNLSPIILQVKKTDDVHPWDLLLEIQGDPFRGYDQVKQLFERITQLEFSGEYLDKQIANSYAEQQRMAKLIIIFSIIACLISFLGLLAMSTYFIRQRSREVAVRKVFGSSNSQVLKQLIATFISYVGIAFILATPLIWYILNKWIADYPYRIPLYPWIFVAAGLFCLFIAFSTVFWQSWQAANENPVNSVKAE